ncbi:MAG: SRPBCC family protein [Dehalococcoidia bacterium]
MGLIDWFVVRGIEATGLRGEAETYVAAAPERVYQILSDVTRMGEWSPECYRCVWLGGASAPAVGARFRGDNWRGWLRWSTFCTVTEAEPGRVFAFETKPRGMKRQTRWRYEMEPHIDGTLLRESFEALWYIRLVFRIAFGSDGAKARLTQLEQGAKETLARIKAAAEAEVGS